MNWLRRTMMGRYGADQLSIAMLILYFVVSLVGQFTHLYVIVLISYIPMVLCFFRILSRNTSKRYQENYAFLKLWNPVVSWFKKTVSRMKDSKYYRYYKCPNCSNTLRVPKGKGKICITCPVCKKEFIKKT